MNILFYTTDLSNGRERLMPWRTVLEVAIGMQKKGHKVIVLNGVSKNCNSHTYIYQGVVIKGVKKDLKELATIVHKTLADALFIECKWRDAIKGFNQLKKLKCKKYAYFSGGVYDKKSVQLLLKVINIKYSKAYLLETLIPKAWIAYRLKQAQFTGIIGLSPYTTQIAQKAGCTNAVTILPGKDTFEELISDESILKKYQLNEKRFLCYTGAPSPIRGAQLLLQAIDKININNLCVVFLMRTDVGSDFKSFNEAYQKMKHPNRVIVIKDHLTREQLKAFFERAWYMVLPFVVVPSEIPLTFFEIMSCSTPIISFKNGGTSEYLKKGLFITEKSVKGMSEGITKVWGDDYLRAEKSKNAKQLMENHETWDKITQQWLNLI